MAARRAHTQQAALDDVARRLHHAACPLRASATQPVAGAGNPNADILFLGEAPGKNEDETGKPFVGLAGRVLTELLNSIGLTRDDVFITSIEKFRPPKNRDPRPTEIMACFPYLEEQIAIIQPKIIVTLGRHALRRMLEWENDAAMKSPPAMDAYHGRLIVGEKGHNYFPVHHPAAALYNRKLLPQLQQDFTELANLIAVTKPNDA